MSARASPMADTHCHLSLPEFDDHLGQTLKKARDVGVEWILAPGIDIPSSRAAVEMAEKTPGIYAAVGLHPHHAGSWKASTLNELRALSQSPQVVAIGEIGLDYYRNFAPAEDQRQAFQSQLDLAAGLGLPVIVHNRQASRDIMEYLVKWSDKLSEALAGRAGVLHAFSADLELASAAIGKGFYLGVAGPVTYPKADQRKKITRQLPLERLVLETDSPFLTPHPFRGRRNEPSHVTLIARELAALHHKDMHSIAMATSRNASILFGWDYGADDSHLL